MAARQDSAEKDCVYEDHVVTTDQTIDNSIGVETIYHIRQRNIKFVGDAIEQIGMGPYQWRMFLACGFGFVVDQVRQKLPQVSPICDL
ncbi:uncharacterized protein A1O9_12066 [Exophiala aquamarina CBS 119918]|uniref:Uncharacterized protein n=1 Tax=Exophiala aquamarina CBS 119918 TaxID=1182545 RepID=A0A072NV26_9EURO|nr:uncharacterized protein A1O9_12066 [Exophiala aquamarina CBS 119918]KEF51729.1 hypothetical protein A1O9_12066 [Exophiala aquamarina CBS 119918]